MVATTSPSTVVAAPLCLLASSAWASGEVGSNRYNPLELRLDYSRCRCGRRRCGCRRPVGCVLGLRISRCHGFYSPLRRRVRGRQRRQRAVITQCFVDQVSAFFAVFTDQDSVLVNRHVGAAGNLLHEIAHKTLLLPFRARIRSALLRNWGADDVELVLRFLSVVAVRTSLDQFLVVTRSFVRFFFLLVRRRQSEKHLVVVREARIFVGNFLQTRLRTVQAAFVTQVFDIVIKTRDLKVMHSQVFLHFSEAGFHSRTQRTVRILLQKNFETLLSLARVRDGAIGQSHLPHLCLGDFQTRIVGKRIRGKEREPVLVSLSRLNQRTGGAFKEE